MDNNKINGIDVSEYFIEVVDESGSTIDYKVLPNSERLLVKKIFEQNQQLKRLQEENEKLKQQLEIDKNQINYFIEENERLKETVENYRLYGSSTVVQPCNHTNTEYDLLVIENKELKEKIKSEKYIKENALQEATKYSMKSGKFRQALKEIREIAEHWLKNDWSCYYCRSNMDEKLKKIIKLTRF